MQRTRLALEVIFGTLAVAVVALCLTYAWPDNKYGLSGWMQAVAGFAQAVGSILAILAAANIATKQSQRQFDDARRIQQMDRAHQAYRVAKATAVICSRISDSLMRLIREFNWDRTKFHEIADARTPFDRKLLAELNADLDAIPLHEVSSARLVEELLSMRSAVRQTGEKVDLALQEHRRMDASHFSQFFYMLDDAHLKIAQGSVIIERIAEGIRAET
jgi:hypothetical protein